MLRTEKRPFTVRRLSPEEAMNILKTFDKWKETTPVKSYNITSDGQRFELIRRVVAKEITIKEAARIYGLKYTTAKTIWKIYKHEGRFDKLKQRAKQNGTFKQQIFRSSGQEKPTTASYIVSPQTQTCDEMKLPDNKDKFRAEHIVSHIW